MDNSDLEMLFRLTHTIVDEDGKIIATFQSQTMCDVVVTALRDMTGRNYQVGKLVR